MSSSEIPVEGIKSLEDNIDNEGNDDFVFQTIIGHEIKDGNLYFQARYINESGCQDWIVPFKWLKNDAPLEVAHYIKSQVVEASRRGAYSMWANTVLQAKNINLNRIMSSHGVNTDIIKSIRRLSRNGHKRNNPTEIKFGHRVPISVKESLKLDKENDNSLWRDEITKEMDAMEEHKCFEFRNNMGGLNKENGWQYAPLHMIFDIKSQDMRRKARLVVGGHVVSCDGFETYSSTVKAVSVRLVMIMADHMHLSVMSGDVCNSFLNSPSKEKIWSRAGPEFGEKEGCIFTIKKAIYGTRTAAKAFHDIFADCLRRMDFLPTRADQYLWYIKSKDYNRYDYITTHIDDFMIASKKPSKYFFHYSTGIFTKEH